MWDLFKQVFKSEEDQNALAPELAIASILVRAARSDFNYEDRERKLIIEMLVSILNVTKAQAQSICDKAEIIELEIKDNVQIIKIVKSQIPYDDRQELVKILWKIMLADGQRTDEENGFMRLISKLLGVSDIDSALARSQSQK